MPLILNIAVTVATAVVAASPSTLYYLDPTPVQAKIHALELPEAPNKAVEVQGERITEGSLRSLLARYGASESLADFMVKVAICESGLKVRAEGDYRNGVPTSFGIWQFHGEWPLSKEQRFDPELSTKLAVETFQKGEERRWTCARSLRKQSSSTIQSEVKAS